MGKTSDALSATADAAKDLESRIDAAISQNSNDISSLRADLAALGVRVQALESSPPVEPSVEPPVEPPANTLNIRDLPIYENASRISEFLSVNSHLDANEPSDNKPDAVLAQMEFLGLNRIRTRRRIAGDAAGSALARAVGDGGMKFNLHMRRTDEGRSEQEFATILLDQIDAVGGADRIYAVEGLNEIGFPGWNSDGYKDRAVATQRALYRAVAANTALDHADVINFSVHRGHLAANFAGFEPSRDFADLSNAHTYFGVGQRPSESYLFPQRLSNVDILNGPEKYAVTEFGYATPPFAVNDWRACGREVQGQYILNVLCRGLASGVSSMSLYELADENSSAQEDSTEPHFGLFTTDGQAKPAATAVRNFVSTLKGPGGNGFYTPIEYTLTGDEHTHSCRLYRSDGAAVIVVWREGVAWDWQSDGPVEPEGRLATVTFDQDVNFTVVDMDGKVTGWTGSNVTSTLSHGPLIIVARGIGE